MAKKDSVVKKITDYKVIISIQVFATLVLVGFLFKLGALPMKYILIILAVLVLLGLGTFFMMKPAKAKSKGKVRNAIGKCLSILLSVVLLFGSLYVAQGDSTISNITGANSQVIRYDVVVLKDHKAEKLSDLKGETVEVNLQVDSEQMQQAIDAMKKEESSLKVKDVKDFEKMSEDLYDGKVEAIYFNEAYRTILEEKHPQFETESKVIYAFEIEEKIEDISKNVNVTKDPFVIYVSGIDTYGKVSTVSRSDVNMLVTVNPKTKQVLLTSIPRDYWVPIYHRNNAHDKLTHSGLGGIESTIKTMENFMDIDINYYARINFTSLIKMVDALGGVDVNSIESFQSVAGYSFKKGINHINGEQALAFSRERYNVTGGDNGRVANQQRVITAMINKMISPAIITNYSKVLKSIDGSFETNMESRDITSLLQMQLNDISSQWNIVSKQLSGTGSMRTGGSYMPNHKLYYMIPNQKSVSENKQYIENVLAGKPVN